ncbi:MAG TPA: DUF6299 family protein [Candidatus Limnocylindria bacterium]
MKRLSILVGLAVILNLSLISPALAAPPANDTYASRTVIGSLPFSDSLDTTEATTDADDVEMNSAICGAPATDASVWYELTPAADGAVIVDVSASTYSAGVIVATGSPGSFSFVTCGPNAVIFDALSTETYSILAFDDQLDGDGISGGTLNITVDAAPPAPEVVLTVDPVGHFTKSGSAIVSGTVTCTGTNVDFSFIDVQLQQRVGRLLINGFGSTDFPCDGDTHDWSVEVFADNGLFKGGHAATVIFAVACDPIFCGEAFQEVTIKLRK